MSEEKYIVSARKYRPSRFETVVGQKSVTDTLSNAIEQDKLAQAYLFCGPRGVGKTTCARIFANEINKANVEGEGDFSNNIIELDAASNNSVEDIRYLIDLVRVPPQVGKYKVYIIDEVHMLSTAAFNAFLKTLEEPPEHAVFILATTEKHKILPTILSRCQVFDFNRIKVDDMAAHLAKIADREKISYDDESLHLIAEKADGGLRDALSIFDQVVSFSDGKITYDRTIENLNVLPVEQYFALVEQIEKEDIKSILLTLDDILKRGFDAHLFINDLAQHYRNILLAGDPASLKILESSEKVKSLYEAQSKSIDYQTIFHALEELSSADVHYKTAKNKRLLVELTLMRLASIKSNLKKKD